MDFLVPGIGGGGGGLRVIGISVVRCVFSGVAGGVDASWADWVCVVVRAMGGGGGGVRVGCCGPDAWVGVPVDWPEADIDGLAWLYRHSNIALRSVSISPPISAAAKTRNSRSLANIEPILSNVSPPLAAILGAARRAPVMMGPIW